MSTSRVFPVAEPSQIGEARRMATAMAKVGGLSEAQAGKFAIAVTEAATNLIKHAGQGEIHLRAAPGRVELLSLDRGPGITDAMRSLGDGHSTAGTPGTGLGAISRLASYFDLYSAAGRGTAIFAAFGPTPPSLEIGYLQTNYPGEQVCGDAWTADNSRILVADGLGHGPDAAAAAHAAVEAFRGVPSASPEESVNNIHAALRSTRGAAVAVAALDNRNNAVTHCGLGNISGSVLSAGKARSMISMNGTAGSHVSRVAAYPYEWPENALLVMHTDGISARWDIAAYPGLARRHPSLIAAVIHRDFRRGRDDATIVVVRRGAGE